MKNGPLINSGSKVAVMGLGVSGRAAVRYGLHCGAEVFVSDNRPEQLFLDEDGEFITSVNIEWEAGGHTREFLGRADLLLVSPGVNLELPLLKALRDDGVMIAGEFAVAAGQIEVPVVAVSGTNGKTTVTTLIGEIFKRAGKKVFVGGNIGTPLYDYLCNPRDYDIVVAEVSSFQLESAGQFSPDVGLLLNISPDHLDRHISMEKYVQAKMQLFAHQDLGALAIINGDDELCGNLPLDMQSVVCTFGKKNGYTAVIDDNRITLTIDDVKEEYQFDGMQGVAARDKINEITLMNYAAAILTVRFLGCNHQQTKDGLNAFSPLPHRIEFVAEVSGVSYYNDSKATNTGAVIGALAQFQGNVILIAGGRDKGDDFSLLKESVRLKVKKVVTFGEAAGLLEKALTGVVDISPALSMDDAVQTAARAAVSGDVVLLSPACASFDMFSSYGHRGNEFKKAVLALETSQ